MQAKFGIYFIPQPVLDEKEDFYLLGSALIGYDIWRRCFLKIPRWLKQTVKDYDEEWVEYARPYGFHLTIGDAIYFEPGDLSKIEVALESLLCCFNPAHQFVLTQPENKFVDVRGQNGEIILLAYQANDYLKMFHTAVVTLLHPLGTGSLYTERLEENAALFQATPHREEKVKQFYSPTALDEFYPHFTLFNPYKGTDPKGVQSAMGKLFAPFKTFEINKICLVVQHTPDKPFEVYREYPV